MFQLKTLKCYRGRFVENCGICGLIEQVLAHIRAKHANKARDQFGEEGLKKLERLAKLANEARRTNNKKALAIIHDPNAYIPWLVGDDTRRMRVVFGMDTKARVSRKRHAPISNAQPEPEYNYFNDSDVSLASDEEQDAMDAAKALLELPSGASAAKKAKQAPVAAENAVQAPVAAENAVQAPVAAENAVQAPVAAEPEASSLDWDIPDEQGVDWSVFDDMDTSFLNENNEKP